ncbi:MAG: thiamine pyrophosphate-binding protein [Ideonella sp.]|nr:thiamine pyrophosphate-binding protein [Ideonella sp.]
MSVDLSPYAITATTAVAALRRNQVDHVVTVPDWVQLALHDRLNKGVDQIKVINCCNENQAVTVAAGLTIGGKRPLLMMQNQGLYNCFNTLRAVCLDAHIPMVFMVGQFGREYANLGQPSTQSGRSMVSIAEPFLQAIGVPYHCLDSDADMAKLDQAYEQAQSQRTAVVLLVSAPMAWR